MKEAMDDFGYLPEPHDLEGVVEWFRERGHGKPSTAKKSSPLYNTLLTLVLVLAIFMLVMSLLPVAT